MKETKIAKEILEEVLNTDYSEINDKKLTYKDFKKDIIFIVKKAISLAIEKRNEEILKVIDDLKYNSNDLLEYKKRLKNLISVKNKKSVVEELKKEKGKR